MNWWASVDPLVVIGLILLVSSFLGFRLGKWLQEKTNLEDDKFIKILLAASRFIVVLGSFAALCFGGWFVWPAIVTLSEWVLNSVIIR